MMGHAEGCFGKAEKHIHTTTFSHTQTQTHTYINTLIHKHTLTITQAGTQTYTHTDTFSSPFFFLCVLSVCLIHKLMQAQIFEYLLALSEM